MTPRPSSALTPAPATPRPPLRTLRWAVFAVVALLLFAGLVALGTWQVQRRAWKLDLIERVEQRVRAPAVPAPAATEWPQVSADAHEYRHVWLQGRYLQDKTAWVQASTTLGAGFWLLTPLRQQDGSTVWINRGFVPPEARETVARAAAPAGEVRVEGLLRLGEPGGGFLRRNDAAAGRWYSRDVLAMASAHGLGVVAPYFVDADGTPRAAGAEPTWPAGGLTVVSFRNHHLLYALTWYALALMLLAGAWYVGRDALRQAAGTR